MNRDFWQGRRVLVTGHTGFKGAWATIRLASVGAEVCGLALAPEAGALFELAEVGASCRDERLDVRDPAEVARLVEDFRPEVIVHMAAQSLVRPSYERPVETFATNVMGTVNLLEAARRVEGLRAIVVVTSDKCYENQEWPWGYRETDPLGGHDPYSASKGAAEIVAQAYARSFFQGEGAVVATARAGNVIGGGDRAVDRLVPDAIRAFEAGRDVEIRRPTAVRPWQHVLEPLEGYFLLAERLVERGQAVAGAWNFGPSVDAVQPVSRVIETVVDLWGEGRGWVDRAEVGAPHEPTLLQLDSSKARTLLGWRPRWSLERTLAETVGWYAAVRAGASARRLCEVQIAAYEAS